MKTRNIISYLFRKRMKEGKREEGRGKKEEDRYKCHICIAYCISSLFTSEYILIRRYCYKRM